MSRGGRRLVIGLGVALGLFVAGGLILVWRLDAILNKVKDDELPKLSEQMGRPLHVGKISTTLFTGFGVTVEDVSIGADAATPADKMPLLSATRLRVRASALRALFSLGKTIRVSEISIESPVVNIVRLPDGRLNLEQLAARMADNAPRSSEPMSERTREMIENARIDDAHLVGARVRFVDLKDFATTIEVSSLGLALHDVGLKSAWTAELTAALLAPSKNLELRTRFGAAGDLERLPPPLEAVRLKLDRTDLKPLAPFLSRAVAGLQAATAAADLDADLGGLAPNGHGPTKLKGGVQLGGVHFADGAPFDAALDSDVDGDFTKGDLDVKKLLVTVARMGVSGHGKLRDLDKQPRFEDFAVETRGVDFDALRAVYPALDRTTGLQLHGPLTARVVASGTAAQQTFDLDIDLTQSSIVKPKLLDKPRGTALRLHAQGKAESDAIKLDKLGLQLADLDLHGGGTVRHFVRPIFDVRVDAELNSLGGLLRLLPGVAAELPAGATVAGALAIHANAAGSAGDLKAHAEAKLSGANLKLKATRLSGGGVVVADVTQKGKDSTLHVDADLSALEAFYEDVVHKPASMPMSLKLDAQRAGTRLSPTVDLKLGTMHAHADGVIEGDVKPMADLTVRLDSLTMESLGALMPALATGMPPIALSATAHVQGRSDKPELMRAEVKGLKLTSRKSELTGDLSVKNLVRPEIELTARSSYLDTADLLPKSTGPSNKTESGQPPRESSMLANAHGHASVEVARGIASGVPFERLQAELQLDKGRVRATKLEVGAWGGHFSGSGSEFDLVDDKGPFRVVGKITQLDVEQLLSRFGDSKGLLKGKLSADVDTRGRGTAPADLQKSLEGTLGGSIEQAQLLATSLGSAIAGKLASQLPLGATAQKVAGGTNLRTLTGQVQFAAGAMHLSKPMTADTPEGPLSLNGRIMLDGRLDLTGTFKLTPEAVAALLGNKVKLNGPLPLSLHLGGDLRHPSVDIGNAGDVVKLLIAAGLAAGVGGKAQELLDKSGVGKKLGVDASQLPTSEADARAKAEAAAQKAQAEAQRRVEEEARRRADDAKKQLEKQAQDRLKNIFGR
ncbi:MAG: AsmA family protein [Myxococcales bacterium]|nr:AsmA family protein [Myxococcales bacterium]